MGVKTHRSNRQLGLLILLLVGGCGPGAIGGSIRAKPYALADNSLSLNGLVANGLLTNGLRMNGLRMNGLRMNGLRMNGLSFNDLAQDDSLKVMKYLVECALPAGASLSLFIDDVEYPFDGALGLAPSLEFDSFSDPTDQEWVSACLLARTNTKGEPHRLSMRGPHPGLALSPGEEQLTVPDSVFFGNLFADSPSLFVCDAAFAPGYDNAGAQFTQDYTVALPDIGRGQGYSHYWFGPPIDQKCWPVPWIDGDVGLCQGDVDSAQCAGWTHPIFTAVACTDSSYCEL
jgi:hypothetical protein